MVFMHVSDSSVQAAFFQSSVVQRANCNFSFPFLADRRGAHLLQGIFIFELQLPSYPLTFDTNKAFFSQRPAAHWILSSFFWSILYQM